MEKKLFTIQSEKDGLVLDAAMFVPEGTIKGIFQISHGMAEHKERYFAYMEFLASQGYVAVIHDHRGHGKSVKTEEDLGYFYDNRAEYIVEDVHQIIAVAVPPLSVYRGGDIYQVCAYLRPEEEHLVDPIAQDCVMTRWHYGGLDIIAGGGGKMVGIKR